MNLIRKIEISVLMLCSILLLSLLISSVSLIKVEQKGLILNIKNTVLHFRDGILIRQFGDTEVLTDIGKNFTACKLSGDTAWLDIADALENVTYLGWGDQGSLSSSSVILPSEITRYDIAANFTYISLGKWNYTGYWKPTGTGNIDCVGLYWKATGNNLFCYDVFGEIAYTTADSFYSYWQFEITYS
jgi:hypothetical protein